MLLNLPGRSAEVGCLWAKTMQETEDKVLVDGFVQLSRLPNDAWKVTFHAADGTVGVVCDSKDKALQLLRDAGTNPFPDFMFCRF